LHGAFPALSDELDKFCCCREVFVDRGALDHDSLYGFPE
jgi:hypothetical protein